VRVGTALVTKRYAKPLKTLEAARRLGLGLLKPQGRARSGGLDLRSYGYRENLLES
jgi:hypothetical protein